MHAVGLSVTANLPEQTKHAFPPMESRIMALMRCAAVLAVLGCGISAAAAEFRIHGDNGGQIGSYLQKFAQVRDSGERVVIDGPCFSACTLALAVIPRNRICVTPNAVLGFHAAWTTDRYGHTSIHAGGTDLLMASYPPPIKSWIARRSGLNGTTITLRGRELAAIYPRCR
jgi:hypothetical protein